MAKLSRLAGLIGRTVGVAFVLLLAAGFISLCFIEGDREVGAKLAARISGAKTPDHLLETATPPRFDPAGMARQLNEAETRRRRSF